MSEPCPLNDLSTEESPLHFHQPLEAASVVTDENVFLDSDVDEEDKSASNKVKEATGMDNASTSHLFNMASVLAVCILGIDRCCAANPTPQH